jgi:hypothetical protein
MRSKGIIHDASTAERWEEFQVNCRNNCEVFYKIGFIAAVFGDIIILSLKWINMYFYGNHLNALLTAILFSIGAVFLAFGGAMLICSLVFHLEIKKHNSKRFPPKDVFS